MTRSQVQFLRALIAEGCNDTQIIQAMNEAYAETMDAADFERDAYGIDYEDGLTSGQREYNDRLDMGRNEAGEWLGFM